MPQATPKWKNYLPEFLSKITNAQNEDAIRSACEAFKRIVCECYPNTPDSRRRPMTEARKAIRERFPAKETGEANAPFPYFFALDGKGSVERWEHLAIKYLKEEWNPQTDWSDKQTASIGESQMEKKEVVKQEKPSMKAENVEVDILGYIGLTSEELENVKQAVGDADVKEWLKQAVLQRANAINALQKRLDEDLSLVPSEELMSDKKYRTNTNACRELTSRAVRAIKAFNAQSPEYRWCITNALISELTGNTVKVIAKAVEGMDIESYNKMMGLKPVQNRLTKAAIGDVKENVSIKDVLGVDE